MGLLLQGVRRVQQTQSVNIVSQRTKRAEGLKANIGTHAVKVYEAFAAIMW